MSGLGAWWMLRRFSEYPARFRDSPPPARTALVERMPGPFGAWWLRDRIEGAVDVRSGRSIRSAALVWDGARLELDGPAGPAALVADHVIAATGYHVDVDRLDMLDASLRSAIRRVGGAPALSAAFEWSVSALLFAGLWTAPTFGPLMRCVYGAGFTATRTRATLRRRAVTSLVKRSSGTAAGAG